jgi:hypothetical protein
VRYSVGPIGVVLLASISVFAADPLQPPSDVMVRIAGLGRCGDVRDIILRVLPHGGLTLNSAAQTREGLARRLDDIYRTRWSKHVYITSEPNVSFREVVEIIQLVATHVDHVVIVTPSVLKQATYRSDGTCLAPNLPSGYPPG